MDDIAALKPALFIGVPRVFDRIYTGIMTQVGCNTMQARLRAAACKLSGACSAMQARLDVQRHVSGPVHLGPSREGSMQAGC